MYYNIGRCSLCIVRVQYVLTILGLTYGNNSTFYTVKRTDGRANPFLKLIKFVGLLLRFCRHHARMFCKHVIGKTTFGIAINCQHPSCLIHRILRNKNTPLLIVLIRHFHILKFSHNFLGLLFIHARKQYRIISIIKRHCQGRRKNQQP